MRLAALAILVALEVLAFSSQIDIDLLLSREGGLVAWFHPGHIWRALIAFAALSVSFGFLTARREFQRISRSLATIPVSRSLLLGHIGAASLFVVLSYRVVHNTNTGWIADLIAPMWFATGAIAVLLVCTALVPFRVWRQVLDSARGVWIVAAIGAIFAVGIEDFRSLFWGRAIGVTVNLVQILLRPFVPDLTVNPATGTFASHTFRLIVTPACAGFEGAGLMLAFGIAWLLVFRKECRFPHALSLIPLSVVVAWLLNSVRLAALFLIGHAGAPRIALGGFHSQAGWIVFSGVAFGFTLLLQYVPSLAKGVTTRPVENRENPTAWYLMPFLAILATAMITRAASDQFEWLYPLRFFAAALVLWHYRRRYVNLDWEFGWVALLGGVFVFAMWLSLDRLAPSAPGSLEAGLAVLSMPARVTWIVFRVVAASTTVPITEELAFRGFLLRRLIAPDFEKVNRSSFNLLSLVASSVAFGLLHGDRWLAGTLAGLVYAWAFRHRGRIGDAVAAHTITNALLAGWVLLSGSWQMW